MRARTPRPRRRKSEPFDSAAYFEAQELQAAMGVCGVAIALLRSLIEQGAVHVHVGKGDSREPTNVLLNGATIDLWLYDPAP